MSCAGTFIRDISAVCSDTVSDAVSTTLSLDSLRSSQNFANEMTKQKDMKKTQAERRAAMCEELGRGC